MSIKPLPVSVLCSFRTRFIVSEVYETLFHTFFWYLSCILSDSAVTRHGIFVSSFVLCETSDLAVSLSEEDTLRVFWVIVLLGVGTKGSEVTRGWRKLHYNLYPVRDGIRMTNPSRITWAGHVEHVRVMTYIKNLSANKWSGETTLEFWAFMYKVKVARLHPVKACVRGGTGDRSAGSPAPPLYTLANFHWAPLNSELVGSRVDLEALGKQHVSCHCPESNQDSSIVGLVA